MQDYIEVLFDCLIDSIKVLLIAFLIHIIISFFEGNISKIIGKKNKASPIVGSLVGLVPQCGISVVAADLYLKRHITVGTLVAIFFACSDEALPILLTDNSKMWYVLSLILIKFIGGFVLGYIVDYLIVKKQKLDYREKDVEIHVGCCNHHIEEGDSSFHQHFIHPLLHSLKIFICVFFINLIFGSIVYFIGENNILIFLSAKPYISPLISVLVGIIPNCASSVLISQLFLHGGLSFGAMVAGLCVNAGLGVVYLLKNKKEWKDVLRVLIILVCASLLTGYLIIGIMELLGN